MTLITRISHLYKKKISNSNYNHPKIFIVGSPNVGKSVIFNSLTGSYVTVSNYPGTTVEVSRGTARIGDIQYEVIDTPGMYSLASISEEESVARKILLKENPDILLNVVDSKNLQKMLALTLQLIEANLRIILILNMYDEAEKAGLQIDWKFLENKLGIRVIKTIAVTGQGMDKLREEISSSVKPKNNVRKSLRVQYGEPLESFVKTLEELISKNYGLSKKSIALLLLQRDAEIHELIRENEPENYAKLCEVIEKAEVKYSYPLNYVMALRRRQACAKITNSVIMSSKLTKSSLSEKISNAMINPITGFPILFFVLYFGIYQFVGVLGAQIIVEFLEEEIFGKIVIPLATSLVVNIIPFKILQELFIGDYGIITLGIRYAVSIILPIVTLFFFVFAFLEDTGYLPRLALLMDRAFKKIGLSGRAVIPMTLGFGCDTMATIVTRTLETNKERIIATLLLALAIPCSAQLGVIFAILSGNPIALLIWATTIILVFLLIGFLTSKVVTGEPPSFFIELPPIRIPKLKNVLVKTYTRMEWYFIEIFPIFILASVVIWIGQISGAFDLAVMLLSYPVQWIGLPAEASVTFLFGFFRRDYGAAGLFDLHRSGLLSGNSMLVAAVTLTLFLPCIAQLSINIKERGIKTAVAMALFIFPFAFLVGFLLNSLLNLAGIAI
ncbi:MAG: ferrous iron transport protein B [Candidatus Bathyarchaeia archaeon]